MIIYKKLQYSKELSEQEASYRTHLNYVKCIAKLLSVCDFSVNKIINSKFQNSDFSRFKKLYTITNKSIKKDMELVREDPEFAILATPWFPVKCYYALYYLESVLVHLIDGCIYGFSKGGHKGVRKKIYELVEKGIISFGADLNSIFILEALEKAPTIFPGENAKRDFWDSKNCLRSLGKKLMEYKLYDVKNEKKWNLHKKKDREERKNFIKTEKLMLIDFFYWYRIKSNYRDLDYIDFENGLSIGEAQEYLKIFNEAYQKYKSLLVKEINITYKKIQKQ
jgi:hypothetical protein